MSARLLQFTSHFLLFEPIFFCKRVFRLYSNGHCHSPRYSYKVTGYTLINSYDTYHELRNRPYDAYAAKRKGDKQHIAAKRVS